MKRFGLLLVVVSLLLAIPVLGLAEEAAISAADVQNNLNFVWTLIAAFMVFIMQAGFAMVESGFTRAKNACNILMKNMMDRAGTKISDSALRW